jgi:hypothetical protein
MRGFIHGQLYLYTYTTEQDFPDGGSTGEKMSLFYESEGSVGCSTSLGPVPNSGTLWPFLSVSSSLPQVSIVEETEVASEPVWALGRSLLSLRGVEPRLLGRPHCSQAVIWAQLHTVTKV